MDKHLYLIGFKFGKREVIGVDDTKPNYRICKCNCGNINLVHISNINKGNATSCGKCLGDRLDSKKVGLRQGRLLITREFSTIINGKYKIRLEAKCDCGKIITVPRCFRTLSCGCSRILFPDRERHKGMFVSWKCMMQRCYNPKFDSYYNYGAKGVYVCERWHTFINFYNDLKETWFEKSTIDRFPIKNGNYLHDNVRWATIEQQSMNRTDNRFTEQDILDIRTSNLSQKDLSIKYKVGTGSISRIINKKRWKTLLG